MHICVCCVYACCHICRLNLKFDGRCVEMILPRTPLMSSQECLCSSWWPFLDPLIIKSCDLPLMLLEMQAIFSTIQRFFIAEGGIMISDWNLWPSAIRWSRALHNIHVPSAALHFCFLIHSYKLSENTFSVKVTWHRVYTWLLRAKRQ